MPGSASFGNQVRSNISAMPANSYSNVQAYGSTRNLLEKRDTTWVANDCEYTVNGTIYYNHFYNPNFRESGHRTEIDDIGLAPYELKPFSYSHKSTVAKHPHPSIDVTLRTESSIQGNTVNIEPDQSVVTKSIGPGILGCNIYKSYPGMTHRASGEPLLQIYANT